MTVRAVTLGLELVVDAFDLLGLGGSWGVWGGFGGGASKLRPFFLSIFISGSPLWVARRACTCNFNQIFFSLASLSHFDLALFRPVRRCIAPVLKAVFDASGCLRPSYFSLAEDHDT